MNFFSSFLNIFLHIDQNLDTLIQQFGIVSYLILFLTIFCETGLIVTPFLPGDSLLFAAGTLAARGSFDIWLLAPILLAAAILGDAINYWVGFTFGRRAFKWAEGRFVKAEYLARAANFYDKHGNKAIVLARFMPIIRTFAPFVAGLSKMPYRRFSLYNILGALLWVSLFTFGGYFFGSIPAVKQNFTAVIAAIIVISFLPGIVEALRARHRRKRGSSR